MLVRKRPVEVEAFRWDGSEESALVIINWAKTHDVQIWYRENTHPDTEEGMGTYHLTIHTLEGDMIARPGYWIIKGVKGEFYGCEPQIFTDTYEASDTTRGADQRLADLIEDVKKIHSHVDGGENGPDECWEDVEKWPCPTIQAVRKAEA